MSPAREVNPNMYDALDLDGEGDIIIDDADIDFSDLEAKYKVKEPQGFATVVIVDGVPVVDEAKEEKLLNVIKKIFKGVGEVKDNGTWMPKDPKTNKTKGYVVD